MTNPLPHTHTHTHMIVYIHFYVRTARLLFISSLHSQFPQHQSEGDIFCAIDTDAIDVSLDQ